MPLSDRIATWILRYNWQLLAVLAVLLLGLASGGTRLGFSADNRAFFGTDNQDFRDLVSLDQSYSGAEGLFFMIEPPVGQSFAPQTLAALQTMTEDAWFIPYVLRVDSAVNYTYSYALGDDIIVEPLLADDADITDADAERFRDIVLASDELLNRLVAADGSAFGLSVQLVLPEDESVARREVMNHISDLVQGWRDQYPGFEFRKTGSVWGSQMLVNVAVGDLLRLVPIAFVVVSVLLSVMLRSLAGVLASMAISIAATAATLGFAGWTNVVLTAGTAISPLSVMVLIAASCIHMMLSWMRAQQDGAADAVHTALAENLGAITVTNLTTAFGFLCLNFAYSPPLRDMGNIVAFGLIFGLFATFTILPLGLRWANPRSAARALVSARAMGVLAGWILRHSRLWLIGFPVLIIIAITGIFRIGFDDNLIRYFDQRFEFRQDADAIAQRFAGFDSLKYSFRAPEGASVFEPEFLRQVDQFSGWLSNQPGIVSVTSITQILKRLNMSMNGDDPDQNQIADTQNANAQLMMFYELSLPVGMDLNARINVDRTEMLVTAALQVGHSRDIRDLAARSEAWLTENTPQIASRAMGGSIAFARIAQRNNSQMLIGLAAVLILISGTMIITLRSLTFGLLSLVPNLVPALLAFGLWGYTFQDVNLGSTVVTTMTFGIVVDDTVHFLMHYLRRRRAGMGVDAAMRDTFSVVGAAIIITSVALIAGFAIMTLSGFVINQHIGALTAFVVGFALLADLLFLPALLATLKRARV